MSLFNNSRIELKYHQHLNLNHIYLVFLYGIHNAILQLPTGYEFLIIIVIIVVLFFGVKKIPELARFFGKGIAESLGIDYTNKNDDDLRKAIEGAVNKEKS